MRWILEKDEFDQVRLQAHTCKYIDSGCFPTTLHRLVFDDAEMLVPEFCDLVTHLITQSGDKRATFVVLDPDPIHYFWRHFHKYPAIEIKVGDSAKDYLRALNEDPGGSPADALGTNWWECVIVTPSCSWFVHALRDDGDRGGHLWVPEPWTAEIQKFLPAVST
jgi:hypothetical protein